MAKDLRGFLDQLRSRPGDLVEVERPVRPHEFEVTALLQQLEDERRYPAVWFKNPLDQYDQPSPISLVSNLYATRGRCALMLDADPADANRALSLAYGRAAARTIVPEIIAAADAPVRQNVWQGAEADAGRLPIVRHFEMDLSPTLTMSHVMRSKEGFYDASFIKTFYKWDPKHMVVSIHTRDLVRIHQEYEERGEPAPIVNVLGHHPAFSLGVVARNPWQTDDYTSIGSFLGEPLRLTPSVTWGDRFLVPADAEVIIEGEIPPGQRDVCDPFGEVAGLYQAQCLRPVFEVKAITFRNGAIMQDIFSGYRDSYIGFHSIVKEAALEEMLRPRFPNLHEVHLPDSGNGMSAAYISIRDASSGQAQEIGHTALNVLGLQLIVVVDADIDVFNETQVLWAMHTYSDPEEGFVQSRTAGKFIPQHTGPRSGFGATNWAGRKLVVDATRPTSFAFGARAFVPSDVIARMPLRDYLPREP